MISSSIQTVQKKHFVKDVFSFMNTYLLEAVHYFSFGAPHTMVGIRRQKIKDIIFGIIK